MNLPVISAIKNNVVPTTRVFTTTTVLSAASTGTPLRTSYAIHSKLTGPQITAHAKIYGPIILALLFVFIECPLRLDAI